MALGASVAVATDPTFQFGTAGVNDSTNTIQSPSPITVNGVTWATDAGNGGLLKPTAGSTAIDTINIVFEKSEATASSSVSGSALTITAGGQIKDSRQPTIQITSSQGLKVGKIAVDFYSAEYATDSSAVANSRTAILDLSSVASGVAFEGNIELGTGSAKRVAGGGAHENYFIGKFGGNGMKGDIIISKTGDGDGFRGDFIFSNSANLDGNLTLNENNETYQKQTFVFGSGDILGTISSKARGTTTVIYGQNNKTISSTLDLMAGTLEYQFANTVTTNKIFTLNSSKTTISGGGLSFRGASQVVFNNGALTIQSKDDGGVTYKNGYVAFYMDSATPNQSNPIVQGDITANNGSVIFALNDLTSVNGVNPFEGDTTQPTNTYYVDGNITITNGGLSAFWDDEKGFYGKIDVTSGKHLTQTGGFIGKNDAWFATSVASLPSIQATMGTSHLVFESAQTITGAKATIDGSERDISILASNGSTQILFKNTATITGDIFAYNWNTNNVTFEQNATITGNIATIASAKNYVTAKADLTVDKIVANLWSQIQEENSRNVVKVGGDLIVNKGIALEGHYGSRNQNQITLTKENANLTINSGGIIARQRNGDGANEYIQSNHITFEKGGTLTLKGANTTTDKSNFNFDGIFAIDGHFNTITFKSDNNATIDVSQNKIIAFNNSGANNFIFEGNGTNTIKGQIVSEDGKNNFNASKLRIEGSVISKTNGKSSNNFSGLTEGGDLALTITEGLYAGWYSANNLTLGDNGSLTITAGGIVATDEGSNADSGSNTITASTVSITASKATSISNDGYAIKNSGKGTNSITAQTVTIRSGAIYTSWGENSITATTQFSTDSDIIAHNSGTNTITAQTWDTSEFGAVTARGMGKKKNIITVNSGNAKFSAITTEGYNSDNKNASGNTIELKNGNLIIEGSGKTISAINGGNINSIKAGSISVSGAIYAETEATNKLETTTLTLTDVAISAKNGAKNEITATNTSGTATIAGISTSEFNQSTKAINTIDLGSGSVTINKRTNDATTKYNDKAIYAENGGNSNIITANTITVNGDIYATVEATNSLTASSSIGVTGNIGGGATNNFTLTANSATLTLNGNGTVNTTHQITSLTATTSGTNTLTLENSTVTSGAMETTIHSVVNGSNLDVVLKGKDTTNTAKLILDNANGTTLKSVSVQSGATTSNTLAFNAGNNKVLTAIEVGSGKGLNLDLSGTTSLNLISFSKGSGNAYINVNGNANATLTGGAVDVDTLAFKSGTSTLTLSNDSASLGGVNVEGANATLKGLAINTATLTFSGTTSSLNLANAGATIAGISVSSENATLSGIALSGSNLSFTADGTSLTLSNAGDSFGTVNTTSANGAKGATLTIGGNLDASIAQLQGDTLNVNFAKREQSGDANLSILDSQATDKTITLKSVSVASGSTNNTLDLSSLSTVGIGSAVSLADGTGLTLKLKDTNLTVTGGTDSRITDEAKGALTISVDSGVGSQSTATSSLKAKTSGSLNITSLDMVGDGKTTVTFLSDATIGSLIAQADNGSNLVVGNTGDKSAGTKTPYSLTISTTNSTLDSVTLEGGDTTTLAIKGGTQTINTLTLNASANELTLSNKDNLTIGEIVNGGNTFNVTLTDSTLSLAGATNQIETLVTDGKSIINLAVGHNGTNKARSADPKLTIGKLEGDLKANILVSKSQTDQIKINDATNKGGSADTLTLYARGNAGEIISITRGDNILVVDASGALTQSKTVDVVGGTSDLGGLVVKLNVEEEIDDTTKQGTGKWYVGKTEVKGADVSFQEVASTALAVNYDLYLANFNSLNKRMGELRDNPYNQGVWARVFGGAMSNDIGAGSKTNYVTAQAGYDYSLTLGDARNYMGIAVAYGSSWTKANEGVGLTNAFLDNINSQMAEVGIYNSYVADSGWYNDTIFKFDYIMSDFDITVQGGGTSTHNTNNFAMVLSDEFGYRYKFAESAKGNWYIDPQVEMAFGYFNQSDFNQAIANNFTTVEASQDAILTLRTRAGMSLGKKFISAKGFATLYVGAFYEYDYIEGGNAQTLVLSATNSIDRVESNGRAIVNIGSNIELTDGVRMYIDVEKSFGDKQRTDMQFNFGARYSFGDKTPSTSYLADEKKRSTAPLKVEEKPQATQESKAEAPANTEAKQ